MIYLKNLKFNVNYLLFYIIKSFHEPIQYIQFREHASVHTPIHM